MEYYLSLNTRDNCQVNHIVSKEDALNKTDFFKNMDDFDHKIIEIVDKKYILIKDYVDVDSINLMNYFNNNFNFCYEVVYAMLYFMDSRIEKLIEEKILDILSNKYNENFNRLLHSHFGYMMKNLMTLKKLIFDQENGKFINYEIDSDRTILVEEKNNNKTNIKILVRTLEILPWEISPGSLQNDFYFRELLETKMIKAYISNNDNMYILYSPDYGSISKVTFYQYLENNRNKIVNYIKLNPKIDKIFRKSLIQNANFDERISRDIYETISIKFKWDKNNNPIEQLNVITRINGFFGSDVKNVRGIEIKNGKFKFKDETLKNLEIAVLKLPFEINEPISVSMEICFMSSVNC